ncbi:hypothetical protein [Methylobacterium frigidaeris]|uniref:Uncharacterized protein n=1 Tax=Methylobacterium frigidaeris TaxID=2038277 RepID=A0AA37HET0_9HYPH|nr:hypothetical protein [Methylobacterium frigidaeris]GJD64264.1 hypothetical protein MPEAHAMD_4445 [Methylobacterium frigidaeris]
MVPYAICLLAAGTLLGTFARLPALLAVLCAVIVALVFGAGLSLVGIVGPSSTAANVVVAIVAVQVGYGIGVILRAIRERFRASTPDPAVQAQTEKPRSDPPIVARRTNHPGR